MDVREVNTYKHLTATGLVFTGPCLLHTVVLNDGGAGSITVYNGIDALGDVIAIIDSATVQGSYLYDVFCATGIHIVIVGTIDITVTYAKVS
jgi:hypothetical protein